MIAEDNDFRLIYVLWRWCLSGATESKGFGELAYQISDIKELSGLPRTYINRTVNGKRIGPDPDSMLSAPEDPNLEKLTRVVFSLLRCGRFEEAMKLSGDMYVPWLVPLIRSQLLLVDSSLISAELTKQERARFHFRKLFYQTMVKAISETKYSMGIRMVFAAIAGDWQFLLPLAVTVDDRLWCYANLLLSRLNTALGIEHPIFAPTTVEGIFEAIATSEPSPYYILMSYMMRGAWEEAVDWMYSYCLDVERSREQKYSRCTVFSVLSQENHGKNLVGRMIDVLLQKQVFSLIPFYAALLPKDDALKRIWDVMPRNMWLTWRSYALISACGDKKLLNAIAETNGVLRYYLLGDMEDEASALIDRCEQLKLVDRLAALVKNENSDETSQWATTAGIAIDEYNNHCLYLRTFDAITAFVRHPGWRSETEEDWGRSEQLKALRERCYANMLSVLIRDLRMCNDTDTVLDVLAVLADEGLELYKVCK
ncbi:hypothetical protein OSTOST_16941, partial [Ostertagia ostertagi]